MSEQALAGWYPQPDGTERYWNGTAWTDHVTPQARAAQAPTQPITPYAAYPLTTPIQPSQPGFPTYAGQHPGQWQVAPKSPGLSLLASFFLPGLGSMINGDVGKGVLILLGYLLSFVLIIVVIGLFGILGFWIWGMVDGYQGAQRWNARHGIIS